MVWLLFKKYDIFYFLKNIFEINVLNQFKT